MPELDSEALDFRAASELFAPVRKLKRSDLETLRLVTTHQGRKVPTTAACRAAGLAPPVIEEIGTRFRVTLRVGRVGAPSLDETERAILEALAGGEGRLTSEIAKSINLTSRATRTRLVKLVERGLVREVGTGPQDPKRRYFQGVDQETFSGRS